MELHQQIFELENLIKKKTFLTHLTFIDDIVGSNFRKNRVQVCD